MLINELCPGSVAEIELVSNVQYVYDCVFSKGSDCSDYALGSFKCIYTNVPKTGSQLVNVNVTNCEDGKVYRYPNSAIVEIKKDIITVGSVFDIDYRKVRQCRRYKYDTFGILIHKEESCVIQIVDISGNGVGFKTDATDVNVGDTVYIKFVSKENRLVFEKVRVARIAQVQDGYIIGCSTIENIIEMCGEVLGTV